MIFGLFRSMIFIQMLMVIKEILHLTTLSNQLRKLNFTTLQPLFPKWGTNMTSGPSRSTIYTQMSMDIKEIPHLTTLLNQPPKPLSITLQPPLPKSEEEPCLMCRIPTLMATLLLTAVIPSTAWVLTRLMAKALLLAEMLSDLSIKETERPLIM